MFQIPRIVHEDFEKSGDKPAYHILHLESSKPGSKVINTVRMDREQRKLYEEWRTKTHRKDDEGNDLGPIILEEVFPDFDEEKIGLLKHGIPESEWEEIFAEYDTKSINATVNGEAFTPPKFLKG